MEIKIVRDTRATARQIVNILESFIENIVEMVNEDNVKEVRVEIEEASSGINVITTISVPKAWNEEKITEYIDEIINLIEEYIVDASPL